ncbi:MAG: GAF domain-containing protein [Chloroflexi bacterium]|nr:GAF domain-containing protein [Chloroflexota bacterium]
MFEIIKRILSPSEIENAAEKKYATRALNISLWAGIAIFVCVAFGTFATDGKISSLIVLGMLVLLYLLLVYSTHRGQVKPIRYVVVTVIFLGMVSVSSFSGGVFAPENAALITISLTAGLLLELQAVIGAAILGVFASLVLISLQNLGLSGAGNMLKDAAASSWVTQITIIFSSVTLVTLAWHNLNETIRQSKANKLEIDNLKLELNALAVELENQVNDRTANLKLANETLIARAARLQTISEINLSVSPIKNLEDLLQEIAGRVRAAFDYAHVGISLLDADQEHVLWLATDSQDGKHLLDKNPLISISANEIIRSVIDSGLPRITMNAGETARFFTNPDFPETRAELTFPLMASDKIIGLLDIHSSQTTAFSDEDIKILSLLSNQISIAVQNARLFGETQAALVEAQNNYIQSAKAGWREIGRQNTINGYRYSNGKIEPVNVEEMPQMATPSNEVLPIPIKLRGQILGSLNIRQPGRTHPWSEAEIRPYQSIVERLSFALENARLYMEAQKRAERERTVSDITSKIRSTNDPNEMIQIALNELKQALNVKEAHVADYAPPQSQEKD